MRTVVISCALALTGPIGTLAETYLASPDGTGDFPTIQAAINAANDGDEVVLADGVFLGDGNRDLTYLGKAITIRSESDDPESCILDCEGSTGNPHRGVRFIVYESRQSVLRGITIRNGWMEGSDVALYAGGAIYCEYASPAIEKCIFRDNTARSGGAMIVYYGSSPLVSDCLFEGNDAYGYVAGGLCVCVGSRPVVTNCIFRGNGPNGMESGGSSDPEIRNCEFSGHPGCGLSCGDSFLGDIVVDGCRFFDNLGPGIRSVDPAVAVSNCSFWNNRAPNGAAFQLEHNFDVSVTDCLIYENWAEETGGAVWCRDAGLARFVSCTFVQNGAGGGASAIDCGPATVTIEKSVIAFGGVGAGVGGGADLSCCDIFGNAGGDWVGNIADQFGADGNISEDPLFCNSENFDFSLHADSPCAPDYNPECGLIGALPVGCGGSPALKTTWGAMKALFRTETK